MQITDLLFGITNWAKVPGEEHLGTTDIAMWHTRQFGPVRVHMVKYSLGIWPTIGARRDMFLLVVAGEFGTELVDSRQFTLGRV